MIKDAYQGNFKDLPNVPWSRFVWNRASTPKSKFILWLIVLHKLKIKSELFHMKLIDDDQCPMCLSVVQTIDHLFFSRPFSARCLKELCKLLHLHIYHKQKATCLQRKVIIANICKLCSYIWKIRNEAVWQLRMSTVDKALDHVRNEIKSRFSSLYSVKFETNSWFTNLVS